MELLKRIEVIETPYEDRTEWGISFTSNNPEAEDYFECVNKTEAFRLKMRIEKFVCELEFIFANPFVTPEQYGQFMEEVRSKQIKITA